MRISVTRLMFAIAVILVSGVAALKAVGGMELDIKWAFTAFFALALVSTVHYLTEH